MSTKLEQAIAAIKAGDKKEGRKLLAEVIKEDRGNEQAWLWLTQTDITHDQKIKSLQHVLRINPNNQIAKDGLAKLQAPQKRQTGLLKSQTPQEALTSISSPPKPVSSNTKLSERASYITTEYKQIEQQHVKSLPTDTRLVAFIIATAIAGLPPVVGLLVFAINQEYRDLLIFSNNTLTQPLRWILRFVFVVCISLTHFGIRHSIALLNKNGCLGLAGIIGSLLLVFLALNILLFCPVALAIMNNFGRGGSPF
ncbi:MAG: hypothetical protein GWN67_22865 [Phycisphaerae bacterium]|nr:hypothetical protein [Phycisphaerae bacterium]NIW91429.1 hypothetical protein [Phycisphaerae bacterium]